VTGSKIPGITPNLDKLAAEGMRFLHGHVTIALCQPCREVLMKEQYPSGNGLLVRDVADHPIHRRPAAEAA
jgi:N-sulfoglucosamine sulfohydrolase